MRSAASLSVDQLKDAMVRFERELPGHLVTSPAIDEACRQLYALGEVDFVRATRAQLSRRYRPICWGATGLVL